MPKIVYKEPFLGISEICRSVDVFVLLEHAHRYNEMVGILTIVIFEAPVSINLQIVEQLSRAGAEGFVDILEQHIDYLLVSEDMLNEPFQVLDHVRQRYFYL